MESKGIKVKNKIRTIDIVYIGIFAALIAICSWISIPLTVPITLQTMGVCLTTGLLGTKRGTLSVVIYILLGLIGLPVFSGFKGGVGVLFGVTGGYIVGFIFTALIVGIFSKLFKYKTWALFVSMVLGIVICYFFGTVWFLLLYNKSNVDTMSISAVLSVCVTPFIGFDIIKIILSVIICKKLKKYIK